MSNRRTLKAKRNSLRRCPKCRASDPVDRGTFWLCWNCQFPWLKKGRKRER